MTSILVVDDNQDNLYLLEQVFAGIGYSVATSRNGREALEQARRRPPDAVISDILMPEMDGFELCRRWKSDKALSSVPFIFYSATYRDPKDREFALSLGADRFILKPQRPEVVIQAVEEAVGRSAVGIRPKRSRKPDPYSRILSRKLEEKVKKLEAEIAVRKQAQEDLLLRNAILTAQLETTKDAVLAVDERGGVLFLNKQFVKIWGVPYQPLNSASSRPSLRSLAEKTLQPNELLRAFDVPCSGSDGPCPEELLLADGRILKGYSSKITGPGGRCFGRIWYFRDHTEQIGYEKKVALQAELLDAAIDSIFLFTAQGDIVYANRNAAELRGYTVDELTKMNMKDLVHPDKRPLVPERLSLVLRDKFALYESTHAKKNGSLMQVEILARVVPVEGRPHILASTRDVTVRNRTMRALTESEERFRTLFEVSPDIMCTITLEGDLLTLNPAFESITGWSGEEWLGRQFMDLLHPDDLSAVVGQAVNITLGGPAERAEGRLRTAAGDYLTFDFSFAPYSSGETMAGLHVIARDITERKRAESALKESEEKFRSIFDHAGEGILLIDGEKMRFAACNPACSRMTGYTGEDFTSLHLSDIHPPEAMPDVRATMAALLNGEADVHNPVRIRRKDGSVFDAEMSVTSAAIGSGRYIILIFSDITERVLAERELHLYRTELERLVEDRTRELKEINDRLNAEIQVRKGVEENLNKERTLLRTLIDALPDQIYAKDRRGRFILANKPLLTSLGLSNFHQILGKNDFDFLPGEKAELFHREEQVLMKAERPLLDKEDKIRTEDAGNRWHLISKVPFYDDAGTVTGIVGINRDITRLKRTEKSLARAKKQAEAANTAKSAFLAGISHEIRTPMNAILGFSRLLLRDPEITPQQRDRLSIINHSGEHLISLLNDVLEISRIESGRASASFSSFDPRALINDVRTLFSAQIEEKGLAFSCRGISDLPRTIISDEIKLREILINLVGNAVKFTAGGSIEVRMGVQHPDETAPVFAVDVTDTGGGMGPRELKNIFDEFVQGRKGRETGGSGLGLALSRRLARLLRGDLTAESTMGRGSTFRLRIPVRIDRTAVHPEKTEPRVILRLKKDAKTYHVLIVDDNRENRQYLYELLSGVGFSVTEAESGTEAIDFAGRRMPDLVFMDINMTGMDGYKATRKIRQLEGGAAVPIIAITANAFAESRTSGPERLLDRFITKPFMEEEIFEAVRRHLHVDFEYQHAAAEAAVDKKTAAGQIRRLPAELTFAMVDAARKLEIQQLLETIDRVERLAPAAAALLRREARSYRYDQITAIIQEAVDAG